VRCANERSIPLCANASVSADAQRALATDETHSSAPPPNSRLLSAEEQACPHTTYVRELASQTTKCSRPQISG